MLEVRVTVWMFELSQSRVTEPPVEPTALVLDAACPKAIRELTWTVSVFSDTIELPITYAPVFTEQELCPKTPELQAVALEELPITTELHAPVPPTEELPKTMVPVAPVKVLLQKPIMFTQLTLQPVLLLPITLDKSPTVTFVLPRTVEHELPVLLHPTETEPKAIELQFPIENPPLLKLQVPIFSPKLDDALPNPIPIPD